MPFDGENFDYDDPILRAADFIEQNPELYAFHAVDVPACGSKACLLGWVGFFAGAKPGENITVAVTRPVFGLDRDMQFYLMMDEAVGEKPWTEDAKLAAQGLRAIAATRRAELAETVTG